MSWQQCEKVQPIEATRLLSENEHSDPEQGANGHKFVRWCVKMVRRPSVMVVLVAIVVVLAVIIVSICTRSA